MIKRHFYSHLVNVDSVLIEMDRLSLTAEERNQLLEVIYANMHHIVLDTILSCLQGEDKKIFLSHLVSEDHEKIWQHLRDKIYKAEEHIVETLSRAIGEFQEDIIALTSEKKR